MGCWVVFYFPAQSIDASVVTEEEPRVVCVEATALRMTTAHTSHNMTFTAFEVKIWKKQAELSIEKPLQPPRYQPETTTYIFSKVKSKVLF